MPVNGNHISVTISNAKVSRYQTWFQALPVIGAAHQWLHFTDKVSLSMSSIMTLCLGGMVVELRQLNSAEL